MALGHFGVLFEHKENMGSNHLKDEYNLLLWIIFAVNTPGGIIGLVVADGIKLFFQKIQGIFF